MTPQEIRAQAALAAAMSIGPGTNRADFISEAEMVASYIRNGVDVPPEAAQRAQELADEASRADTREQVEKIQQTAGGDALKAVVAAGDSCGLLVDWLRYRWRALPEGAAQQEVPPNPSVATDLGL